MIKLVGILVLGAFAVSCGNGFHEEHSSRPNESQEADSYSENLKYLELVNEFRIIQKLNPLVHQSIVEEVSLSHSTSMGLHTRPFGHAGVNLRCRRLKNRLGRVKQCLELVAMGQKDIKAVFNYWISSPDYRKLLGQPSLTHTGLGFYQDTDGVGYWTEMFIEL